MARLLFAAKRPANNPINGYHKGDLIEIFEDGVSVGSRCNKVEWIAAGRNAADWPGTFATINVTGVDATKLQEIRDRLMADMDTEDENGDPIPVSQLRQRLRHIDIPDVLAALPQAKRDKLINDGEITVTWASLKTFIKDKVI